MKSKPTKVDRIASMFLERYGLKEEMDSLTQFIFKSEYGLYYLDNGEVITREELNKRLERQIEILRFVLGKARETTLSKENKLLKNLQIIERWYK